MRFEQAYWAAAVFLVTALVLILRFRRQISEIDRRSYALIVAGVGLLLLASIMQIGRDYLPVTAATMMPPALFVQLVWGIIGITGLSLMLIGVTNWVPLVRRHRQFNDERFGRLNLLRHLEQLLTVEHRLDVILTNTLESIITQYNFSAGSVHKISARGRRVQLTGAKGMSFEDETELLTMAFEEDRWLESRSKQSAQTVTGFSGFPEALGLPWKCLPVLVDDRAVVVFLFWVDRSSSFTGEDAQIFSIIGDILSRKIAADRESFAHLNAISRLSWRNRLDGCYSGRRDLKENLKALVERLREQLTVEIASLTILRDDRSAARATVTANGASLIEPRVEVGGTRSLTRHVLSGGEPVLITDTRKKMTLAIESAMGGESVRSLIAQPISVDAEPCGMLVLASTETDRYTKSDIGMLSTIGPVLAMMIRDWRRAERESRIVAAVGRLVAATDVAVVDSETDPVFGEMAETLHDMLGIAAVRIMTVKDNREALESQSLYTSGDLRLALGATESIDMALLPAHGDVVKRAAMLTAIPAMRIDSVEARQVYGCEVQLARIEPVLLHGRVIALISVGVQSAVLPAHTDKWLHIVSRLLTIAVLTARRPGAGKLSMSDRILRAKSGELRMRSKMKSSLTGILGSLEILKSQSGQEEGNLERYLSIIDRSARRLQTYLEGARETE